MSFNLYKQFSPLERAELLLGKYPILDIKEIVNGNITQSRKANNTYVLNYWNEVSIEIKKIIDKKEIR